MAKPEVSPDAPPGAELCAVFPVRGRAPQYVAAVVVNLASFAYGTVMGWASPTQPLLESAASPLGAPLSKMEISWLASAMCLGAMPGTLTTGAAADRWGRKVAGWVVGLPMISSWVLILTAGSFAQLLAARVLAGFACGGVLSLVPLYVGEVAEVRLRGRLGSMVVLFLNGGILLVYAIGSVLSFAALSAVCLVVPVLFLLLFWFLPDTPAFHVNRGEISEATRALLWLRGGNQDKALGELSCLTSCGGAAAGPGDPKPSALGALRELLGRRGCRRALTIIVTLFTVQQLSGVFAVLMFSTSLFQASGSGLSPHACSVVVGALQLAGSYLACVLVDRLGRRLLLVTSCVAMGLCSATIGAMFYLKHVDVDVSTLGWVTVVAMSVYIVSFALGIGPVPYVLVSEMFPDRVRSTAGSLGMLWTFLLAFIVSKFFDGVSQQIGIYSSFWGFACWSVFGALFTILCIPETKGRNLADIVKDLEGAG